MKHNRAYRRRMNYLKDKRRRELCEYIPFWKNIWFDKDKDRVCENTYRDIKRYAKKIASRQSRRNPSWQMKGCGYKKVFNVPYTIC